MQNRRFLFKCPRLSNHWGEHKQRLELSLTPTAIEAFDNVAMAENISISELLERLARCKPGLNEVLNMELIPSDSQNSNETKT